MNADSGFARHVRPELARLFRALNLDAVYRAGQGDHLTREPRGGAGPSETADRVLDLVGGAGSSLFGHNHPKLLDVARRCFDERSPFNAQASIRPGAGELGRRLSQLVGATTGASYVVTLGSTGADAVEGAVKHATVEHRRRLGALDTLLMQSLFVYQKTDVARKHRRSDVQLEDSHHCSRIPIFSLSRLERP